MMKRSFIKVLLAFSFFTNVAFAAPGDSQSFGEKDWATAVKRMAALDGKLYVTNERKMFEVDKSGKAKPFGPKDMEAYALTTLGGKVYCIAGGVLYEVEKNGRAKKLSNMNGIVPAMAGLDDKLYIVQDEILVAVDTKDGKSAKLSDNWYKVEGMAALDGKLYILSRDNLHEVDTTGKSKIISEFVTPYQLTAFNGKLYVASSERSDNPKLNREIMLFEVDPSGSRKRLALPKGWNPTGGGAGITEMAALDGKLYMLEAAFGPNNKFHSLSLK